MKVIGVVGLPASGKGEVSRIAGEQGIPVIVMGDAIRRIIAEEGIPPTDENLGGMAEKLRQKMGRDAIAQLTIPSIEAQSTPVVLVDGIRSEAEVLAFKSHFDGFMLIGIHSSFSVRFQRMIDRKRSDDLVAEEQLRVRDERELGWGLGKALEMADYTIVNEGTLESFQKDVRELLLRLEAEECL